MDEIDTVISTTLRHDDEPCWGMCRRIWRRWIALLGDARQHLLGFDSPACCLQRLAVGPRGPASVSRTPPNLHKTQ